MALRVTRAKYASFFVLVWYAAGLLTIDWCVQGVGVQQADAARAARQMGAARRLTPIDLPGDPQLVHTTQVRWLLRDPAPLGGPIKLVTWRLGNMLLTWTF